jgi:hypothetical protein
MATLSGNKVKDTYQSLLKLESNGATSTLKSVEDGAGVVTALKISTDAIGVEALSFTTAPTAGTTELKALMLDSNNNVIQRDLNFVALDGATAAFVDSTNAVNFAVPTSSGNILFEARTNMDITYDTNTVTFNSTDVSPMEETFIGCVDADVTPLNTGDISVVSFTNPDNATESTSFHFGNSPARLGLDSVAGEYIENVSEENIPLYIDMSASAEVANPNANITYYLQRWDTANWTTVKSYTRFKSSTGLQVDSFWGLFMLDAGERVRIAVSSTTGNVALKINSQFIFTAKETGNII